MCMSIEYHLYLLHFFYHVNDYNLFIIFVFMFMGGSMPAHNYISNIFVVVSYMNHVSQ